ncbi:Flagellar motor switch protein FliG, partial [Candidatus Arthromitus sp. SFB-co]
AENVREEIEYMGPVKLSDVEKAQQVIVSQIRKLDEQGEILIVRGGDDDIIQ